MHIHKEGRNIILVAEIVWLIISVIAIYTLPAWLFYIVSSALLLFVLFIIRFFRVPTRQHITDPDTVYSPADGRVVTVEEVYESEYLNEPRIQVSVFMSVWNVHVNWYPVGGTIEYFRYHDGRFLVAWHPKSSTDNERTTTVVSNKNGRILFRQIAGVVARRIVSYSKDGDTVEQNTQCGFIKFGSRVDMFLPMDADVKVKLGDHVVGTQTVIATLKKSE